MLKSLQESFSRVTHAQEEITRREDCILLSCLPSEILLFITEILSIKDIVSLSFSCASLRNFLLQDSLWKLRLVREFGHSWPSELAHLGANEFQARSHFSLFKEIFVAHHTFHASYTRLRSSFGNEAHLVVKTATIGTAGTGKSSLLRRHISEAYDEFYAPTIGVEFFHSQWHVIDPDRTYNTGPDIVKCQIWDTVGRERYRALSTPFYYRGAHAIIIVFSISDRKSFDEVRSVWHPDITKYADPDVNMVLVGSKSDLEYEREVSSAEAQELATSLGCKYIEVSAKSGGNVEKLFGHLVTIAAESAARKLGLQKSVHPSPPPTVAQSESGLLHWFVSWIPGLGK